MRIRTCDAQAAAPEVLWWAGEWGCFGWLLAVLLLVPTVGVRNLLLMPVYDRRIRGVVRRMGPGF